MTHYTTQPAPIDIEELERQLIAPTDHSQEMTQTAEELAQYIAGEDLELTGFSVKMRDALVARLKADRNATRLALLDEIYAMRGTWENRLIAIRDKYTQPVLLTKGEKL